MKYKYILLDVDNTLFDFDACEELAFYRCMQALGVCATKECFQRYCVINKECWHALELGQMTKEELQNARFSRLATEFSLPIDPDAANDLYLTHLGQTDVLIEGAIEFVSALADHAKLYVITNGLARVQTGRLSRSPLTPYFEKIFISEKIGAAKPDVAFFERVSAEIEGFCKEHALVIGDSLTSDIQGANNFGIDCIWYNPKGQVPSTQSIDLVAKSYNQILDYLHLSNPTTKTIGAIHEN